MSAGFVSRWRQHWVRSLERAVTAADRDSRYSSMSRSAPLMQTILLGAGALLILDFRAGGIMIGG